VADNGFGSHEWSARLPVGGVRVVRPSNHFDATVAFYRDVIGLHLLGTFSGSYGEDGAILGLPGYPHHLELVRATSAPAEINSFDQLVFYLQSPASLQTLVQDVASRGHQPIEPQHPYWEAMGAVTFHDPDGRGVVFAPWVYGRDPEPKGA